MAVTKGMSVFGYHGEEYAVNDPNVANEFSASEAYSKGDYCSYQGKLWRFTRDHAAGAWNAAHVENVILCENVKKLDETAGDFTENGFKYRETVTSANPDFDTYTDPGIYGLPSDIDYVHAPEDISFGVSGGILQVMDDFNDGRFLLQVLYCFRTIDMDKIHIRKKNASNVWSDWTVVNGGYRYQGTATSNNPDFNTYTGAGYYGLPSDISYVHAPSDISLGISGGILEVFDAFNDGRFLMQVLYSFRSTDMNTIHIRKKNASDTWSTWVVVSGGSEKTVNVTNEFNEYSATYNVTASPTITTDTNNYLASTGDTTDRTADIVTMLTQTGVCNLGPGVFYVKNLIMPENTSIIGSGTATEVILAGTAEGFAIQMMSECNVKDLSLKGVASGEITLTDILDGDLSPSYQIRHGILWEWEYTKYEAGDPVEGHAPTRGLVSNVRFNGFTGGAITCYDTGLATNTGLECENCYIYNCNVGINILYYSEFSKFTNITSTHGYYGVINNGGSNVFSNCNFCRNVVGMLFDATINGAPNNTHASASDCIIGHIGDPMNTGIGIKMVGCANGYNFTGLQMFFSSIYIEDCQGIVFSNCNFGKDYFDGHRYDKITIDGGGAILFADSMFENDPVINVTSNENVHFINCYNRATGEAITP